MPTSAQQSEKDGIAGAPWIECGKKPVLDPGPLYEDAVRNGDPTDWYGKANSIELPRGYKPGKATLLMLKRDAEKLPKDELITITWHDGDKKIDFHGWIVLRFYSILPVLESEKDVPVIVELADVRWIAGGISEDNNGDGINAGGTFSSYRDACEELDRVWRGMIDRGGKTDNLDQPGETPATPGAKTIGNGGKEFGREINYPDFPDQVPQGVITGNAWELWYAILRFLMLDAVLDPFEKQFKVIDCGTTFTAEKIKAPLIYDYADQDGFATSPNEIVVYFPKYGNRSDGEGNAIPISSYELATDRQLSIANSGLETLNYSVLFIERDIPELKGGISRTTIFDSTGADYTRDELGDVPEFTDEDTAKTRARAKMIAKRWLIRHKRDTTSRQKHYAGVVKMLPNQEVATIVWRDYGDGQGTITELHYGEEDDPKRPYLMEAGIIGRGVWQVPHSEHHPKLSAAFLTMPRVSVVPLSGDAISIEASDSYVWQANDAQDTGGIGQPAVQLNVPDGATAYRLQPVESASYRVHFHAMLTVDEQDPNIADHQNGLLLKVVVRRYRESGDQTATLALITLTRKHFQLSAGSDPYTTTTFISGENIAGETIVTLLQDDWLEIKNESDYNQPNSGRPIIQLSNAVLTVTREDLPS